MKLSLKPKLNLKIELNNFLLSGIKDFKLWLKSNIKISVYLLNLMLSLKYFVKLHTSKKNFLSKVNENNTDNYKNVLKNVFFF